MNPLSDAPIRLAVVIVTTNDCRWLDECISTLLAADRGPNPQLELDVIVVDNASTDGGAELVRGRFPDVDVVALAANLGFAGANNVGMRRALDRGAHHVFLLNPDTRTPPDLLICAVRFLDRWPEYGIIGPLQYSYTDVREYNDWTRDALRAGEAHIFTNDLPHLPSPGSPADGRAPETLEHAYVQGAALLCRAALLRDVGLFDVTYHTYYEESDLCRRARWRGWRVALVLGLGVQHVGGGGTHGSSYRRRHMQRNKYYFLFTDPDWTVAAAARLAVQWIRNDLGGRGPAAADSRRGAWGDTAAGISWLIAQTPTILRRRRSHGATRTVPGTPVTVSRPAA